MKLSDLTFREILGFLRPRVSTVILICLLGLGIWVVPEHDVDRALGHDEETSQPCLCPPPASSTPEVTPEPVPEEMPDYPVETTVEPTVVTPVPSDTQTPTDAPSEESSPTPEEQSTDTPPSEDPGYTDEREPHGIPWIGDRDAGMLPQ